MDKIEAYEILQNELKKIEEKSFSEVEQLLGDIQSSEVRSKSSTLYQIEIELKENIKNDRSILVTGTINSSNWYKFSPVTERILIHPKDGSGA